MDILELIEPIVNSKNLIESYSGKAQIGDVAKPLKAKRNARKGKGI